MYIMKRNSILFVFLSYFISAIIGCGPGAATTTSTTSINDSLSVTASKIKGGRTAERQTNFNSDSLLRDRMDFINTTMDSVSNEYVKFILSFVSEYNLNCAVLDTLIAENGGNCNLIIFNGIDNSNSAKIDSYFAIVPADGDWVPIKNAKCYIQNKKGLCPTVCDISSIIASATYKDTGGYYCAYADAGKYPTNYYNATTSANSNVLYLDRGLIDKIRTTDPYMCVCFILYNKTIQLSAFGFDKKGHYDTNIGREYFSPSVTKQCIGRMAFPQ